MAHPHIPPTDECKLNTGSADTLRARFRAQSGGRQAHGVSFWQAWAAKATRPHECTRPAGGATTASD